MLELFIILFILIVIIILLYFIFEINISKLKKAGDNKKSDEITALFPNNMDICKSILDILDNKTVKIKEDNENKTSLYIAITNTILIGNIKNNYTRIQTIAHECLHSIQNKKMLLFNFIYSNIYILYFIISIILTICGVYKNYILQICILIFMGFIYYTIRSYLETDAMTKAKFIAKDYMEEYINQNQICKREEIDSVIKQYDTINKIGIPATNYMLFFNTIIKVVIYIIIAIIMSL